MFPVQVLASFSSSLAEESLPRRVQVLAQRPKRRLRPGILPRCRLPVPLDLPGHRDRRLLLACSPADKRNQIKIRNNCTNA